LTALKKAHLPFYRLTALSKAEGRRTGKYASCRKILAPYIWFLLCRLMDGFLRANQAYPLMNELIYH